MFKSIVIGTDGSANAEEAVQLAAELAVLNPQAVVHVVAAYTPLSPRDLAALAATLPEEFRSTLYADMGAESVIGSARSIFRSTDAKAEFHEVKGDPVDAILSAIDDYEADLAIVGSRGEGLVQRAFHGSVSTNVLHHAPCTVLVVKSESNGK